MKMRIASQYLHATTIQNVKWNTRAADTIQGAVYRMKYIKSVLTSGICGRCTQVEPHCDQHTLRFRMPHCTRIMMAMVINEKIMSFQKTVQEITRRLRSLSKTMSKQKLTTHNMNLCKGQSCCLRYGEIILTP